MEQIIGLDVFVTDFTERWTINLMHDSANNTVCPIEMLWKGVTRDEACFGSSFSLMKCWMVSAGPHGHKQIIAGAFLFIYTHDHSVFPLRNISFCPIERSSQRHWCLSILIPMWMAESYKPIPANSTGLMGLIYCISLSETGCQSLQSCISKQEVENCVVRKGSYKMHAQTQTERLRLRM